MGWWVGAGGWGLGNMVQETPLHRASWNDKCDAMSLLLSHGANVHAQNNDGVSDAECSSGPPYDGHVYGVEIIVTASRVSYYYCTYPYHESQQ